MKEFFQVVSLGDARALLDRFGPVDTEHVPLSSATGRVLACDVVCEHDLPGFRRSTMDGFAVQAASTFGASEAAPALLEVVGAVQMGQQAAVSLGPGQAAHILTGGMLPAGADAVVMVEHTETLDHDTVEASRGVAPGQHVIQADDDAGAGQRVLARGTPLRAQEAGLLAALGVVEVEVYRRPVVAILSTGDEVVPVDAELRPGQVRDVNSTTLAALVEGSGGEALLLGIVGDRLDDLLHACRGALANSDMLLVSGGSSVGTRDLTLDVLSALDDSELLVHGVAIRPGKPTILARVGHKAVWGLPGHTASAMVVYGVLVASFVAHIAGVAHPMPRSAITARLSRNLASVHGRVDFVRVRLEQRDGKRWAVPVLGQSGLIRTLVAAQGLVEIDRDTEGLDQGVEVEVLLF